VARLARERYATQLSLGHVEGEELYVLAAEEHPSGRSIDCLAVVEHLTKKHSWIEQGPAADRVARFRVRDLASYPERLEEVLAALAMGRSLLEG